MLSRHSSRRRKFREEIGEFPACRAICTLSVKLRNCRESTQSKVPLQCELKCSSLACRILRKETPNILPTVASC